MGASRSRAGPRRGGGFEPRSAPPPAVATPLAATWRPRFVSGRSPGRAAASSGSGNGEREIQLAALADLALGPDPAAVRFDDALRDVEPETLASPVVLPHLPESLED